MRTIALCLATVACLAACQEAASPLAPTPSAQSVATPEPAPSPFSKDDWATALHSSFVIGSVKSNGDGTSSFIACRGAKSEKDCASMLFGTTDDFKKVRHFVPTWSHVNEFGNDFTYTRIYVAARECGAPAILVGPTVNERGGWLFLRKVAFMADSDVVLEHSFEHHEVDRQVSGRSINERALWVASPNDIEALRKLAAATSTGTRFTGETSYISIPKKQEANFIADVRQALAAYDDISAAMAKAGGPNCR